MSKLGSYMVCLPVYVVTMKVFTVGVQFHCYMGLQSVAYIDPALYI